MPSNSLKIVSGDAIDENGYIAVVDGIIFSQEGLDDFAGEDDDSGFTKSRTKQLRRIANDQGTGRKLKQRNERGNWEDVTTKNCRIRAQLDTRRTAARGFNKVTIPLPEEVLDDNELVYIDDYIVKFIEIWSGSPLPDHKLPDPHDDPSAKNARKFLFGVKKLTKCR